MSQTNYSNSQQIQQFQDTVWEYYAHNKRSMPWREDTSLYSVLISEIMLQQTQVSRVVPLFLRFIAIFSDFSSLAKADIKTLLACWSGLGYNNRALRLRESAKIITKKSMQYQWGIDELDALPGIGHATASAITTYTYNLPTVFIETNIRRVFLHHFFTHKEKVSDSQLLPFIEAALDYENPREWYWALMDYGTHLKTLLPNPNRRSKHYIVQSKFEGSVRQVRGEILRRLQQGEITSSSIFNEFGERGNKAIKGLVRDKVIVIQDDLIQLFE